jgi:hypothetical protein
MRRTLTACRSGLAVAAAVVLLSGCGGSDNKSASSSTSASRSSTAQSSAAGSDSEFCTQAAAALQDVEPAFTGSGDDPSALATALQDAADKVRTIDPPTVIAKDWTALADGIEKFAQAFAGADVKDPAAAASLEQRTSEILGGLTAAATKVQAYLATKCGIAVPTDSASPTS